MTKICLTCKVSKSMNKAELEKVIPEWYKEIEIILYYHQCLIIMINTTLQKQLSK